MKAKFSAVALLSMVLLMSCGSETPKEKQDALSSVDSIMSTGDRRAFVGRQVRLKAVVVRDVVGDFTFWVGDSTGTSQLPVVIKAQADGGGEGEVAVRTGQTVEVNGTILQADSMPKDKFLDAQEKRDIQAAQVYLMATEVFVLN